jgi:hypothetical protein
VEDIRFRRLFKYTPTLHVTRFPTISSLVVGACIPTILCFSILFRLKRGRSRPDPGNTFFVLLRQCKGRILSEVALPELHTANLIRVTQRNTFSAVFGYKRELSVKRLFIDELACASLANLCLSVIQYLAAPNILYEITSLDFGRVQGIRRQEGIDVSMLYPLHKSTFLSRRDVIILDPTS